MWKARAYCLQSKNARLEVHHETKLSMMERKYEAIREENKVEIPKQKERISKLEDEKAKLEAKLEELWKELKAYREVKGGPLRYSDLHGGGVLSKRVGSFTLFNTIEQNEKFLKLLNYTDGKE